MCVYSIVFTHTLTFWIGSVNELLYWNTYSACMRESFFLPLQQTTNTYGWDVVFSLFSRSSSFCSRASFYLKHRNVVHTVCVMPYSILFVAHTHNSICHVSKIDGLENIIDIMQKSEANVKNKIDHNNIIFEMYCVSIWQMRRGVCSNMRIFIGEIKAKHQKQQHTAKRE